MTPIGLNTKEILQFKHGFLFSPAVKDMIVEYYYLILPNKTNTVTLEMNLKL